MQKYMNSFFFSRRLLKRKSFNFLLCYVCQGYRSSAKSTNHYETLRLSKNCTSKEIRDAFITLSKKYHPDKNKTNPKAQEEFIKINEAYNVLIKPESRQQYDYTLYQFGAQHRTQTSSNHSDYYGAYRQSPFVRNPWNEKRGRYSEGEEDYYGFKGVRRQPNHTVAFWIFMFVGIGLFLQILAVRVSRISHLDRLNRRTDENRQYLESVRSRAELLGTKERQLEEIRRRSEVAE